MGWLTDFEADRDDIINLLVEFKHKMSGLHLGQVGSTMLGDVVVVTHRAPWDLSIWWTPIVRFHVISGKWVLNQK